MAAGLAVTAVAVAASLRLGSLASTLLAAYVVAVGETAALTTLLSPARLVTRAGLGIAETIVLGAALCVWQARGRPRPSLTGLRAVGRAVRSEPAVLVLAVAVGAALAYELLLVLTVPPNNWDSLTYHLPRVAAWFQHGGVYWIPNTPSDRLNEFQPLAEQEILFGFVAAGRPVLFALPQYLAELAIVIASFGSARRLGFDVRRSLCSALFFATLPLVALESTTAQNDLVAASLAAAAAALLLGAASAETVAAGAAAALGLGVKLTTALVLPLLLGLALLRGRGALGRFLGAATAMLVLAAGWTFARNLDVTGHVLGHGGGRVEQQASPSLVGSPTTAFRLLFRQFDLTGFDGRLIAVLAGVGLLAGGATFALRVRRGSPIAAATVSAATVALPLVAPIAVPRLAHAVHLAASAVSLPVEAAATTGGTFFWGISYGVNEDLSGFGPIGGPAILIASAVALVAAARGRGRRQAALLGLAPPLFVALLALQSRYNPWLGRFMIVPLAVAAPLTATLFRRRDVTASLVLVAVLGLLLVHLRNDLKPVHAAAGYAWQLTQAEALGRTFEPGSAGVPAALERALPGRSCVGAVLGTDEPAFLLYGPRLERRVRFLPRQEAASAARLAGLRAVVVGRLPRVAAAFRTAGWRLQPLPAPPARPYWTLALAPGSNSVLCR